MPVLLVVAPLLVITGAVLLVGMARGYDYSLGALLQSIGQWFKTQTTVTIAGLSAGLGFIGDAILNLDNGIRDAIGRGIEAFAGEFAGLIARAALALETIGQVSADVGRSTEQALLRLLRTSIPALIAAKIANLAAQVHVGNTITHVITRTLPGKIERVAAITKVYPVTVERVAGLPALVDTAVDSALAAAAIPHAIPRVGDISTGIESLWDQVKRLGKYATVAGLIGLVGATVFSHFKLGWLRCSNVNRVGRFLCGMERGLLDALLAGLAAWLGTISLEAFAKDVQGVTRTFEGEVRRFWRADVQGLSKGHTFGTSGL